HQHPEQKRAVLEDRSLIRKAFLEAARYDQPTNMLARRAKVDFELQGRRIRKGDNLLYIYASACRDESVFEHAEQYDLYRQPTDRSLKFGTGGHMCLGMHLALLTGVIIMEELLDEVGDYDIRLDGVERAYGEHLSGFLRMPIRPGEPV